MALAPTPLARASSEKACFHPSKPPGPLPHCAACAEPPIVASSSKTVSAAPARCPALIIHLSRRGTKGRGLIPPVPVFETHKLRTTAFARSVRAFARPSRLFRTASPRQPPLRRQHGAHLAYRLRLHRAIECHKTNMRGRGTADDGSFDLERTCGASGGQVAQGDLGRIDRQFAGMV